MSSTDNMIFYVAPNYQWLQNVLTYRKGFLQVDNTILHFLTIIGHNDTKRGTKEHREWSLVANLIDDAVHLELKGWHRIKQIYLKG